MNPQLNYSTRQDADFYIAQAAYVDHVEYCDEEIVETQLIGIAAGSFECGAVWYRTRHCTDGEERTQIGVFNEMGECDSIIHSVEDIDSSISYLQRSCGFDEWSLGKLFGCRGRGLPNHIGYLLKVGHGANARKRFEQAVRSTGPGTLGSVRKL